jgi:hypothetical protein
VSPANSLGPFWLTPKDDHDTSRDPVRFPYRFGSLAFELGLYGPYNPRTCGSFSADLNKDVDLPAGTLNSNYRVYKPSRLLSTSLLHTLPHNPLHSTPQCRYAPANPLSKTSSPFHKSESPPMSLSLISHLTSLRFLDATCYFITPSAFDTLLQCTTNHQATFASQSKEASMLSQPRRPNASLWTSPSHFFTGSLVCTDPPLVLATGSAVDVLERDWQNYFVMLDLNNVAPYGRLPSVFSTIAW